MGTYSVIFRTGGTDNFQWHRSLSMSRDEARTRTPELRRAGHAAHWERTGLSMGIGLPDTFECQRYGGSLSCKGEGRR